MSRGPRRGRATSISTRVAAQRGCRQLRSRDRHAVLAHGKSVSRYGRQRTQGDNLYTNSVLALDAQTGKLRWHYQFTPHDLWDWDAQEPLLLVDATFQGKPRKLLLQGNRNGFFYVLDRTDGSRCSAVPSCRS